MGNLLPSPGQMVLPTSLVASTIPDKCDICEVRNHFVRGTIPAELTAFAVNIRVRQRGRILCCPQCTTTLMSVNQWWWPEEWDAA